MIHGWLAIYSCVETPPCRLLRYQPTSPLSIDMDNQSTVIVVRSIITVIDTVIDQFIDQYGHRFLTQWCNRIPFNIATHQKQRILRVTFLLVSDLWPALSEPWHEYIFFVCNGDFLVPYNIIWVSPFMWILCNNIFLILHSYLFTLLGCIETKLTWISCFNGKTICERSVAIFPSQQIDFFSCEWTSKTEFHLL